MTGASTSSRRLGDLCASFPVPSRPHLPVRWHRLRLTDETPKLGRGGPAHPAPPRAGKVPGGRQWEEQAEPEGRW